MQLIFNLGLWCGAGKSKVNRQYFAVRRITNVAALGVVVDKLEATRTSGRHDLGIEVK